MKAREPLFGQLQETFSPYVDLDCMPASLAELNGPAELRGSTNGCTRRRRAQPANHPPGVSPLRRSGRMLNIVDELAREARAVARTDDTCIAPAARPTCDHGGSR